VALEQARQERRRRNEEERKRRAQQLASGPLRTGRPAGSDGGGGGGGGAASENVLGSRGWDPQPARVAYTDSDESDESVIPEPSPVQREEERKKREEMRLHFTERAKFEYGGADDAAGAAEEAPMVSARAARTAAGRDTMLAEVLTRPSFQKELSDAGREILIGALTDVPHSYQCPITMEVMQKPVVAADGHTYERDAIASWFAMNSTSPMTGEPLLNTTLIPNHSLQSAISDFQERRGLINKTQTRSLSE